MNDSQMENEDPAFTLRAVQVFVATVEAESVTRAARRLRLSPSSVSQQLNNLEAALGAALVHRSARMFRLTDEGRLFLARAKRILDDVSAAKAELSLAGRAPPMALRIASVEELDAEIGARWLSLLRARHPNIAVSVASGASHDNHDALHARAVDMIVAVDMEGETDWVEHHPILRDPFILVAAPSIGPVTDFSQVAGAPFIRYPADHMIGRRIEAQLGRKGLRPPRSFEFSANQSIFSMVSALDGWTITTALAFLTTPGATEAATPSALPLPRFSRRLALHARRGALGDLPEVMAALLRDDIGARILPEAARRLPFLQGGLQILGQD